MIFRLTPEMLEGAYEYLRTCLPYRRWNLPEGDSLCFRVSRHQDRFSHFWVKGEGLHEWELAVSEVMVKSQPELPECMGHEMIHLRQEITGTAPARGQHNAEFKDLARLACRRNGWAYDSFMGEIRNPA